MSLERSRDGFATILIACTVAAVTFQALHLMLGVISEAAYILLNVSICVLAACTGGILGLRLARKLTPVSPGQATSWKLLATCSFLWGAGDLAYSIIDNLTPYAVSPSLADLLYFAGYVTCLLAITAIVGTTQLGTRMKLFLDGILAATSIAILCWYYVIAPLWSRSDEAFLAKLVTVTYPVADTVVLFGVLVMLFVTWNFRTARRGILRLAMAMAAITVADIGYTYVALVDGYSDGVWFDPLWPLGYLLIGLSAVRWRPAWHDHTAENRTIQLRNVTVRTIVVNAWPFAAACVSLGLVMLSDYRRLGKLSQDVYLLGLLVMAVIVVRQIMTLIENQRMAKRIVEFNAELESIVERRTEQLRTLYSLSKAVGNTLHVEEIVREALAMVRVALKADGAFASFEPGVLPSGLGPDGAIRHVGLEPAPWMIGQVAAKSQGANAHAGVVVSPHDGTRIAFAIGRIEHGASKFGFLAVLRDGGEFDSTERDLLAGICAEIGTALDNARLYELARHMADIDGLTGLPNHRSAQERYQFHFDYAAERNQALSVLVVDVNNFKFFNDTYGHLAGDEVLRQIAGVLRESCRRHDVLARYGGDEFLIILPRTDREGAERVVCRIVERVAQEGFSEPDGDRVIPLSLSIGAATFPDDSTTRLGLLSIADSRMYDVKRATQGATPIAKRAARTSTRKLLPPDFGLLESMVNAVDNKDYYTRVHSEDVTEYALWIADEIGLSEDARRVIRVAGLVHDVGKIGVPDDVLRKPGQLTPEEHEVMKQHPIVGEMIVKSMPGMAEVLPAIRSHHERWDGRGYPDGLAGADIPFLGRLFAVADAFSAMTTDRPYRMRLSWEDALEEIRAGMGSQFDPEIAQAFLNAAQKRRHADRRGDSLKKAA